jgi:hypothetical protein
MSGLTGNNILAGSSGQGGYEIEQSLRFEDGDSAYLTRTPASAGNRKTWTWSGWVKRGKLGGFRPLFSVSGGDTFRFEDSPADTLSLNNSGTAVLKSDSVFRDTSAWYHVVCAVDTTQASNRVKIYVNGALQKQGDPYSLNEDTPFNSTVVHEIGRNTASTSRLFNGYLTEVHFIDGQALTPSDFGETDLLTNQWIAKKYVGTYGTNGFYLNFSNSASLGADSSGNGNNWTPNNLAATDQVLDSPTNNFQVINRMDPNASNASTTISEGNLKFTHSAGTANQNSGTFRPTTSLDWYFEAVLVSLPSSGTSQYSYAGFGSAYLATDGKIFINGSNVTTVSALSNGDIVSYAAGASGIEIFVNGSSVYSTVTTPGYVGVIVNTFNSGVWVLNFGQDSSFAGTKTAQNNTDANGKGDFYYAPPSGYLALCENNLPDPSIALPGDHFNTVLYTGNGSTQSITGVGFQPNLNWIKARNSPEYNVLHDVLRGANNRLFSNTTDAETTAPTMTSFDSDGFSVSTDGGTYSATNANGTTYAAWNWKANGSGSSNTDGTITSTVSANTTAGFSIVSYTGTGANATVGHGLTQAPEMVIYKRRDAVANWIIKSSVFGVDEYLIFTADQKYSDSGVFWNSTLPTSTVFSLGNSLSVNGSSATYIAYCFHSVEGYSKIGSYTGNGSADGPFVYTGFRPAFVLIKDTGSAEQWQMVDSARDTYNVVDSVLFPNSSGTEASASSTYRDFLSNGFKVRTSDLSQNGNGRTYIYMAFAESPFKYSNAR